MGRDISIAITAKDNFTQTIATMRSATQAFNKDIDALIEKINSINNMKVTLKIDTSQSVAGLKKSINDLSTSVNKAGNNTVGGMGSKEDAVAGAAEVILNTISNGATAYMKSAYGSEGGTLFENALSTGISGAAIGSAISPIIGTAVGAALGVGIGLINGAIENWKKQDEAYKEYVKNQFREIIQNRSYEINSASSLAASQENADNPDSFIGMTNKLNGTMDQMTIAEGKAYNTTLVKGEGGLKDQEEFYGGNAGQKLTEGKKITAEWEASLVNLQKQYLMDAQAVLVGEKDSDTLSDEFSSEERGRLEKYAKQYEAAMERYYKGDSKAGADMQVAIDSVNAIAANAFNESDLAQKAQASNEELISNLQYSADISDKIWIST
jgi:uncharacterized protein YoxC